VILVNLILGTAPSVCKAKGTPFVNVATRLEAVQAPTATSADLNIAWAVKSAYGGN